VTGTSFLAIREALSRLIPNADGRLILVIRHRQGLLTGNIAATNRSIK